MSNRNIEILLQTSLGVTLPRFRNKSMESSKQPLGSVLCYNSCLQPATSSSSSDEQADPDYRQLQQNNYTSKSKNENTQIEMEAGTSSRHSGIGRRRGRTLTRRARDQRLSLSRRRSTRRRSENSESKCDQSHIKRNIWAWLIEAKVIEENIKICCLNETRGHACKRIFLHFFK